MFGIPIVTLIQYAIQYGPTVLKVIEALGPVIEASAPVIKKLIDEGKSHSEAGDIVARAISSKQMTNEMRAILADEIKQGAGST